LPARSDRSAIVFFLGRRQAGAADAERFGVEGELVLHVMPHEVKPTLRGSLPAEMARRASGKLVGPSWLMVS